MRTGLAHIGAVTECSKSFAASARSCESNRTTRAVVEAQTVRLIRLALLVGAVCLISQTRVDPDLWGHVLFGRDIVAQRAIPAVDPYSFTSDRLWINHEWLAEVLLFLAFSVAGSLGIVALKTAVVTAALALMSRVLNRAGLAPISHDRLIAIGLVVMIPRIQTARPQVFSVLLFALLLHSLIAADRGRSRWLLAVPIIMAVWANLHGGFIVGLGVLFLWLVVRSLQGGIAVSTGALFALGLLSIGATLLNPYGFGLWQFLWSTVGLSRPNIGDWQPMFSLPLVFSVPFVIAAGICVFMMFKAGSRLDWAYKLIIGVLFVGAMRVSRLDVFFGIAMVMLVAPALSRSENSSMRARIDSAVSSAFRYRPVFLVFATVIVLTGVSYGVRSGRCITAPWAPESATIDFFKTHATRARVLTWFNWGEYAIWHLGPKLLVSMDGRRETVYSEDFFDAHSRFYADGPDAAAFVRRLAPDFIWLPSDEAVVKTLAKDGWHPVFRGPISTIVGRTSGPVLRDLHNSNIDRCFPNP